MGLVEDLTMGTAAPTLAHKRPSTGATLQVGDERAVVELKAEQGTDHESAAFRVLDTHGLNPAEWRVANFRTSQWTMPNGEEGVSAKYTFAPVATRDDHGRDMDIRTMIECASSEPPVQPLSVNRDCYAFVLAIGDTQYGKMDGEATVDEVVDRTLKIIDEAYLRLTRLALTYDFTEIHIAFLGDMIEGFESQGGANVWRTPLTLTEQIRLVRATMFHALRTFARVGIPVNMVAVPGNHGEAVRLNGKGVTRYDDNHDTDALIAVSEAAACNPDVFGHVKFFTPARDEMVVVVDVAGTRLGHAHGHQWAVGKHFTWWSGQAFGDSPLRDADVLLAGHLHHLKIETNGGRTFIQAPALETTSKWWEHRTGEHGNPGVVAFVTKDGQIPTIEVIRG